MVGTAGCAKLLSTPIQAAWKSSAGANSTLAIKMPPKQQKQGEKNKVKEDKVRGRDYQLFKIREIPWDETSINYAELNSLRRRSD